MRFDEIDINKIVEESLKRDKEMEDLIEFEDRASVSEDELVRGQENERSARDSTSSSPTSSASSTSSTSSTSSAHSHYSNLPPSIPKRPSITEKLRILKYELDGLRTVKPSQQVTFRVFDSSKRRNSNRRTWSDLVEFGELAQSIGTEIVSNQDIQAERCLKDSVVISSYKSIISPTNETAV